MRRIVTVRGSEVKLPPREYDVLRLMVAHAGKVLTHHFMLREIWGDDADVQYLRVYVRSLRQKIETDPERPSHILTETGSRRPYRAQTSDFRRPHEHQGATACRSRLARRGLP